MRRTRPRPVRIAPAGTSRPHRLLRPGRLLVVTSLAALVLGTTSMAPVAAGVATAAPASGPAPAPAATGASGLTAAYHVHQGPGAETDVNACSNVVAAGHVRCFARIRTDAQASPRLPAAAAHVDPAAGLSVAGFSPTSLQSAYDAPSATAGAGRTVAIVDAFDDPNAAADLAVYRAHFGLPPCTTASGCLTKVDEHGGSILPAPDFGWSEEISLDLDMVSAVCPLCHILLVEANSTSTVDLGIAVNTAVRLGADVVSNSYGGSEYRGESADSLQYYNHPGVAIVVSSGDFGYGVQYPASSQYVTSVGGTSLVQLTNTGSRNGSETAWSGAGSGCSAYEPKPAWQTDTGCARRSVADVSAVADPGTGVAVYDTYLTGGGSLVAGGTSAAAPIVGAMYALAGARSPATQMASLPYATPNGLNDVTSGSNGSCAPSYLCTAGAGYDGPTGLGTPAGPAAFGGMSFEDLGCCLASGSGPATTSWGSGRLDVVIRGSDNAVWHKWYAGAWAGFEPLGGVTLDNPAVVSWSPGRLDVFVRGVDNQLWHRWYAGSWSGWEPLGGVLSAAPTVTTWGPGRLDVFVRGADYQLWHRWYAGSWSGWEPLGGALTSAPSATAWSPGRIDVMARGGDNGAWHLWYSGGWAGWEPLGGSLAGAPQVSSPGLGRLDIYAQGLSDASLYHRWYNQGWSSWSGLGGKSSGPPSAVSWAPGRVDLFANGLSGQTGRSGDLMHTWSG